MTVALPRERERERVKIACHIKYKDIISLENLLISWCEFLRGKRKRKDVAEFSLNLMDNILSLHKDLLDKAYRHGGYESFKINDPKPRDIHKASVRDRLLHHALCRILQPYFEKKFIFDSYSCRVGKGTHRAMNRFRNYFRKVSKNNTRTCWVLKCDIRKFFANIDHEILLNILGKYIGDEDVLGLLRNIIGSFNTKDIMRVGLPLGNLTSQLFVNVYMNEFDHSVKRNLKIKYYIRYADDFIILSEDKLKLESLLSPISNFLDNNLKLFLHPNKVHIRTFASGVDYLGWVHFPNHRTLRTTTKSRVIKMTSEPLSQESRASYLGLLKHGDTYNLHRHLFGI